MIVKKMNDKQNICLNDTFMINKQKKSTGQQIRSKFRSNNNYLNQSQNRVLSQINIDINKQRKQQEHNIKINQNNRSSRFFSSKLSRNHINQNKSNLNNSIRRSIVKQNIQQLSRGNSSNKSVKFNQFSQDKSKTHRTSSILKKTSKYNSVQKNNSQSKLLSNSRILNSSSSIHSIRSSINNSQVQNIGINKHIMEKYNNILQTLKRTNKKYNDQLYPQILSSISRKLDSKYKNVRWMRLNQIFPNNCLIPQNKAFYQIKIKQGQFYKNNQKSGFQISLESLSYNLVKNYFALNQSQLQKNQNGLSSIRSHSRIRSQSTINNNNSGIYIVKITTPTSGQKYIIIDDYIPVILVNGVYKSAFLSVQQKQSQTVPLWPFLLQKAYAKYYTNYQCLQNNSALQWMRQFTNCYPQKIKRHLLNDLDQQTDIIIVQNSNKFYPIRNVQTHMLIQSSTIFYVYKTLKYSFNCFDRLIASQQSIIYRKFIAQNSSQVQLSVVQKSKNLFCQNKYQYCWIRLIVLFKQSQNNYRYIKSSYTNQHITNVQWNGQKGQYSIFIIPQFKIKNYDLTLNLTSTIPISIDKIKLNDKQILDIFMQGMMDIAQRQGIMKQLNSNICTYSYIDYTLGLIIQNINNQRPFGNVKILRSIEGLKSENSPQRIKALNYQFRQKNTIQVNIPALKHYTVILAIINGPDKNYLKQFDFGS